MCSEHIPSFPAPLLTNQHWYVSCVSMCVYFVFTYVHIRACVHSHIYECVCVCVGAYFASVEVNVRMFPTPLLPSLPHVRTMIYLGNFLPLISAWLAKWKGCAEFRALGLKRDSGDFRYLQIFLKGHRTNTTQMGATWIRWGEGWITPEAAGFIDNSPSSEI